MARGKAHVAATKAEAKLSPGSGDSPPYPSVPGKGGKSPAARGRAALQTGKAAWQKMEIDLVDHAPGLQQDTGGRSLREQPASMEAGAASSQWSGPLGSLADRAGRATTKWCGICDQPHLNNGHFGSPECEEQHRREYEDDQTAREMEEETTCTRCQKRFYFLRRTQSGRVCIVCLHTPPAPAESSRPLATASVEIAEDAHEIDAAAKGQTRGLTKREELQHDDNLSYLSEVGQKDNFGKDKSIQKGKRSRSK
jgi:hypothetical protein